MKVTVRIHKSTGLEFKTKKIENDGRVTLIKDARKRAEWRPKINSVEAKHGWFGRAKFYADVYPYAEETFIYDYEAKTEERPKWDKNVSKAFISKKILDKAGEEMTDKGPGIAIWLLAGLVIVMGIIQILIGTGRLRI